MSNDQDSQYSSTEQRALRSNWFQLSYKILRSLITSEQVPERKDGVLSNVCARRRMMSISSLQALRHYYSQGLFSSSCVIFITSNSPPFSLTRSCTFLTSSALAFLLSSASGSELAAPAGSR